MLQTALDFSLVSRLTSLVAVDVTPARPVGEDLVARDVPQMPPQGWDFNAVNGAPRNQPVQHAALDRALLDRLAVSAPPGTPDAAENSDGLALPATASPRELLMLAGAFLMLLGFLWLLMNRERRLW